MNFTNSNTTCQTCTCAAMSKSQNALLRSGLSTEEKEALWEILNIFYVNGNPFAYQFTADDVNEDVANVIRQMVMDFSDCAKKVAPLEILSLIVGIYNLANARSWFQLALSIPVLFGPGSLTFDACRNTQAASKKPALSMAFLGI